MTLQIGGFKTNPSSVQKYDIDESGLTPEPIIPTEPVTPEPIEPVEPIVPTEPVEPTEPISPEPVTPEPVTQPQVSIDDSTALKYLSEKLGKEIQSFEDLKPAEKVVNPLDNDPYLKRLYEWREKTGRPLEDWIKYQKDYNSIQDLDVAREFLQYEYPTLEENEIELELRKYIPNDNDDDDDIALKKLELKKYATKGREVLSKFVTELGEPLSTINYPQEVLADLELAKQVKGQLQNSQVMQQEYIKGIVNATNGLNSFKLNLSDTVTLDYKLPEQSKKEIPTLIETMPHWRFEDGSWNHQAVVEDAVKIKHFNDIIKLVYEQGLNAGKEELLSNTKNTTFSQPTPAGANQIGKKGVVIEGVDNYLGQTGIRIKTR